MPGKIKAGPGGGAFKAGFEGRDRKALPSSMAGPGSVPGRNIKCTDSRCNVGNVCNTRGSMGGPFEAHTLYSLFSATGVAQEGSEPRASRPEGRMSWPLTCTALIS